MPVLTLEEINAQNPEKVYDLPLTLNIQHWANLDLPVHLPVPQKHQFDEGIRERLPDTLRNKKGIYMFVVEPAFPFTPRIDYLLYIGRVKNDDTFFKRFYHYVKSIGSIYPSRNIQLLTNLWPEKTFVYFFALDSTDDIITEVERQLIKFIIPSLNNALFIDGAHNPRNILN
jgi:hypothetical protein